MTIIISVKINDGIVMASDSTSTFGNGQTYLHADKIVNLVKGLPIGVMVTGHGGIGQESISTLLKDLRARLGDKKHKWAVPRGTYKLEGVAGALREFLFTEKTLGQAEDIWMKLRLCGYSAGRSLPEIWEVQMQGRDSPPPRLIQDEEGIGPRWEGETRALDRLVLGFLDKLGPSLRAAGAPAPWIDTFDQNSVVDPLPLAMGAMPIQDAIDLARWLVDVTSGYVKFNILHQPKTVGGSTEIAVITKHEGFRWVQRRHFYPAALNP